MQDPVLLQELLGLARLATACCRLAIINAPWFSRGPLPTPLGRLGTSTSWISVGPIPGTFPGTPLPGSAAGFLPALSLELPLDTALGPCSGCLQAALGRLIQPRHLAGGRGLGEKNTYLIHRPGLLALEPILELVQTFGQGLEMLL